MNKIKLSFGVSAFLISFIFYFITLSPTLSFIDTGELATVCIKLGIAHPTGYPLFTIIGNIFSNLPIGEGIYRLNLMCAFITSIAIFLFYNLMNFVLGNLNLNSSNNNSNRLLKGDLKDVYVYILSFVSSLILAFSNTFWGSAISLEVYSLHSLFIILVIFTLLKASDYQVNSKNNKYSSPAYWILFAYLLGLSFSNHLSTVFMSIGLIYIYFSIHGFNKESFQKLLYLAVPFFMALTAYIYFYVRADNQYISWGYPNNIENIYRHISGKQFSIWMFTSTDAASKQFSHFLDIYPKEFNYLPLIFAIFGLINAFINQRRLFYFTSILFVFNIIYAINYDIHDIDTYFLLAFIISTVWIGLGLSYIFRLFNNLSHNISYIFILLILVPLYSNYNNNNLSNNYFVTDYTNNIFKSAQVNSIILSTQWDFWVSASFYYQLVNNERRDIIVIDKELLRKTWYLRYLRIHYPDFYENSRREFDEYEIELIKFEKETDKYLKPSNELDRQNLIQIQAKFANLLNSFVDKNINKCNFYTTYEIEADKKERFGKDYFRIPEGLLFKYAKSKDFKDDFKDFDFNFTLSNKNTYYHEFIMNAYYLSYLERASYLMNMSKFENVEHLLNNAMHIKPNDKVVIGMMKKLEELKGLKPQN